MTTLSIPITSEQERFINSLVKSGKAANKAHAVRQALERMAEDEAICAVMEGERDIREGRVYKGDLRKLLKKFKA
jgi:Arc/MetJ-type ribon-helix-helix transcriptional regulator